MLSRLQWSPAPDIESADTLGAIDFVGSEAHIIDRQLMKSDRQHAQNLYGIDMEQNAPFCS
ncbi:hypothetical protein D3C85_1483610 [compost metagenome]